MDDVSVSRRNIDSDDDNDDDILSDAVSFVGVNRRVSSKPIGGSSRNIKRSEQSIDALSKIFASCIKVKEKEAKLEETRRKIEGLKILQEQNSIETTEVTVKPVNSSEHDKHLGRLVLEEVKILQTHRGERVLNLDRRSQLFDITKLTLNGYDESEINQNEIVISSKEIEEIIKFEKLRYHIGKTVHGREVIYLFRLLTVHTDPSFVRYCMRELCHVFTKRPSFANCITLNEILKVIVNCGADLDRLLPSEELKIIADVDFKKQLNKSIVSHTKDDEALFNWYTLQNLFESILNVVVVVLRSCDPWNGDRLMVLIIVFCSLALDVNFALSTLIANLQNAIVFTIAKFDETEFSRRISQLSRHICNLTDDHHNLSFLIKLFHGGKRANQLKRVTAFRAVNKVLGTELGDLDDVSPEDVVQFLDGCSLKEFGVDFYLWHSVLNMIDGCISDKPGNVSHIILEELSSAMKKLTGTFKEDLRCPDAIKVKDVATRLTLKWSAMKSIGPISQRTMFSYLITEKPSFMDSPTMMVTENEEKGFKSEEYNDSIQNETLNFSAMDVS